MQSGGKGWCKVHDPERAKAKRAAYEAEQSARSADQSVIQIEAAALAERLGGGSVYYYQASTFKNSGHRRALVVPFDLVERLLKELGR